MPNLGDGWSSKHRRLEVEVEVRHGIVSCDCLSVDLYKDYFCIVWISPPFYGRSIALSVQA